MTLRDWLDTPWLLPAFDDGEGVDERLLHAAVAQRFANLLAQLAIGDQLPNLPAMDRAFFNSLAEQTIERAVDQYAHFTEGSLHEP